MNDRNGDPPSPVELALACLVVALEERDPGLADAWVRHAESDALHSEVRRLHAKTPNPDLITNLHAARDMAVRVRYVVKSHVRQPPAKRRKGEAR